MKRDKMIREVRLRFTSPGKRLVILTTVTLMGAGFWDIRSRYINQSTKRPESYEAEIAAGFSLDPTLKVSRLGFFSRLDDLRRQTNAFGTKVIEIVSNERWPYTTQTVAAKVKDILHKRGFKTAASDED